MTRRDFEFIAATLKEARKRVPAGCDAGSLADEVAQETHDAVARVFADRIKITNPLFNTARFLAACGVEA